MTRESEYTLLWILPMNQNAFLSPLKKFTALFDHLELTFPWNLNVRHFKKILFKDTL